MEDGLREQNSVRRGQAGRGGRRPRQGLVRHIEQAPWIPNEDAWQRILATCAAESLRNRLMVTLAYDGAQRREELVQLDVEDFEPAHRLIHLRAETTKSQRAREVAFGTTSSQLSVAYLRERRTLFGRIGGPLFRSTSNRNCGAPLGASSWSKTVESIARRAGAARLSTHTFRHLRLAERSEEVPAGVGLGDHGRHRLRPEQPLWLLVGSEARGVFGPQPLERRHRGRLGPLARPARLADVSSRLPAHGRHTRHHQLIESMSSG